MLDVEEPHPDRAGDKEHGGPARKKSRRPDEERETASQRRGSSIGTENTEPAAAISPRARQGQAIAQQDESRSRDEQNQGMPVEAIGKTPPSRARVVFGNGE